MSHHKRGFTLTELLIVVIVIGILSAVVLPRYNKTLETRKTTEAEGILSAIRTEQERRCTLGKKYVTDMAGLSEIVPNATTDNYEYSLVPTSVVGEGISYRTVSARAISRGSYDYGLYMFSNSDGRICCAGPDCTKLNKDYPLCEELQQNTDLLKAASEEAYECGTRSVAPIPNPPAPRPWEERINGEFVLDKDPDDGGGSGGGDGGGSGGGDGGGPGAQGLDDGGSMSQQECDPTIAYNFDYTGGNVCGCRGDGHIKRYCGDDGTWQGGDTGPCVNSEGQSVPNDNCCTSDHIVSTGWNAAYCAAKNTTYANFCRDRFDEICWESNLKVIERCDPTTKQKGPALPECSPIARSAGTCSACLGYNAPGCNGLCRQRYNWTTADSWSPSSAYCDCSALPSGVGIE